MSGDMLSSFEKGRALERAVRAIEAAILKSSPSLRENTFAIEARKILTVGGVRHEIDVFVRVDLGRGYEAVFIFECKNEQESVGKNDIIVFSEKIDAGQAQRGFFVAKSFTKDARAQATKDARIALLVAEELEKIPVPFDFHCVIREDTTVELEFLQRGRLPVNREAIQLAQARVTLDGQDLDLDKYLREWITETCDEDLRTFPSVRLPDGKYEREAKSKREFREGELIVNKLDMSTAILGVKFAVRVVRPAVTSHFEVTGRGRYLALAPVSIGETTAQFGFIGLEEAEAPEG